MTTDQAEDLRQATVERDMWRDACGQARSAFDDLLEQHLDLKLDAKALTEQIAQAQAELIQARADLAAMTEAAIDHRRTASRHIDEANAAKDELRRLRVAYDELGRVFDATVAVSRSNRRHNETLSAVVEAAYAFADELGGYCSPHGVSATYAQRLRERLDATKAAVEDRRHDQALADLYGGVTSDGRPANTGDVDRRVEDAFQRGWDACESRDAVQASADQHAIDRG